MNHYEGEKEMVLMEAFEMAVVLGLVASHFELYRRVGELTGKVTVIYNRFDEIYTERCLKER